MKVVLVILVSHFLAWNKSQSLSVLASCWALEKYSWKSLYGFRVKIVDFAYFWHCCVRASFFVVLRITPLIQALLCRTCSSNSRISDLTAFCKEIFTWLNSCLNFTVTSQGNILILRQHRDANLVLRLDGGKLLSTKRVLHKHQNGLRIRHRKLIWRIKCCLWMHRQIRHWLKLKAERRLQHSKILQRCPWLQALRRRYIGLLLSLQQTYIVSLIVLRRSFVLHGFRLTWLDAHVIVAVKLPAIFDLILRHRYLRSRF